MDPIAYLRRVVDVDLDRADARSVAALLHDLAVLTRYLQAREIDCNQRLGHLARVDPALDAEQVNAVATHRSASTVQRIARRAAGATRAPALKLQMDQGALSGEHLDVFDRAVEYLDPRQRPLLLAMQDELALAGTGLTPEQFRDRVRREVRRLEADDGLRMLDRQRRDTALRVWTDKDTGMWHVRGRFDPATAMALQQRLNDQLETRFHDARPDHCPDDPLLAQDFLRAHALADLVLGAAPGSGRPEVIIVIDQQTWEHGRHQRSRVDCGPGLDVPVAALREVGQRARFVPVVVDDDGVVVRQGAAVPDYARLDESLRHPVRLDLGRERRHADRNQRRALRAMYRRCAIPGCDRHVSITEPHHVVPWESGGPTDLHLLLPLCKHHHDRLHAERWELELHRDRAFTVRRGGKVVMATGPPAEQWG